MCEVTIVIPNWNGMEYLPACLASLQDQTEERFAVILIDNGSEDGSVDFVRREYPQIRIRAFHRNTGFCRAVNEGIRLSRTPFVILLNNDTICDRNFVRELVQGMHRHSNAFSGSARMMQMADPEKIDDAGDYYCALGWAFANGKGKGADEYSREQKVFSACAGAAIYRRNLLLKLGLFDEAHFAYLEDVDIGYRARLAGYENWYFPKACVLHAGSGASGSRYNAFKTSLASRNSLYLIRKNMPVWQRILNLPFLTAGFLIKTVFFSKKGLGKEYIQGLMRGMRMKERGRTGPGKTVQPSVFRLFQIQAELWINVIRRFQ